MKESSIQLVRNHTTVTSKPGLLADLKSLFKALVLISNILPVFTGFCLAIYFTNTNFLESWSTLLLTISGSTLVMAGALLLNNWYDHDIDAVMDRTKMRPTVTGSISLRTVLIMGITLSVVGAGLLAFTTIEALIYAIIGWVTYVYFYTMWSKRRYTFNTIIGSVSGAVTPLIGWAALAPASHIVPITLFLILFIWQMPHTYAIAMRKCEEYTAAKVAMLPVVRGFKVTKRQTLLYIACLLPMPFLLTSLGTLFVVLATLMTLTWLSIGVISLFKKDDYQWASIMFISSLNYLMILFLMMIIVVTI